jgi:hypothetical protein
MRTGGGGGVDGGLTFSSFLGLKKKISLDSNAIVVEHCGEIVVQVTSGKSSAGDKELWFDFPSSSASS